MVSEGEKVTSSSKNGSVSLHIKVQQCADTLNSTCLALRPRSLALAYDDFICGGQKTTTDSVLSTTLFFRGSLTPRIVKLRKHIFPPGKETGNCQILA